MLKRIKLLTFILFAVLISIKAQEMSVKSFESLSNDLIARTKPVYDINGTPCAVIRVGIALQGVVFDGNVIGNSIYNTGEYIVYLSAGSKKMTIRHDNYLPLDISFTDFGIDHVESSCTYRLTILTGGNTIKKQQNQGNFLVMTVTPASSLISIDNGELRAANPDGILKVFLNNGSHSYRVEADGYLANTGSINMSGTRQQLNIALQSTKATLLVKTNTADTKIFIDEDFKGMNKWQGKLTPGTYLVEARKDGYRTFSTSVTLAKQQTDTITLPILQPLYGSLLVDYDPVDADIYIDNKFIGKSPNVFTNLLIGKHRIKISKFGYRDYIGNVTILENEQASIIGNLSDNNSNKENIVSFNVNGIIFKMIRVKGGTFMMGGTNEQKNPSDDERPVHKVSLSTYYIGETEVTQSLWKAVMGSNPSMFIGDELPVEQVSWNNCQQFIRKLNNITKKNFRLPTEAEWEFAARGGNESTNTQYSGSNKLDDVAWYDNNSGSMTHPVKSKNANELGIYDMNGNVGEWCHDWYTTYSSNDQNNPIGSSSGSYRVYRGGCWYFFERNCRSSKRYNGISDYHSNFLGLRLAISE